jgi:hypothetical protein
MSLLTLRLREDRGEEEAPQPVPVTVAEPEAAVASPDGEVSKHMPLFAVIRHTFRVARRRAKDISDREGGWVNGALAGKPPSVNEQRDYRANRRWLEPGHENGIADRFGDGYHVAIGIPGVAVGDFVSWLFARPFRFIWGVIIFTVLSLFVLEVTRSLTGLTARGSVLAAVLPALLVTGYWGVVTGLLALRRFIGQRGAE